MRRSRAIRDFSTEVLAAYIEFGLFCDFRFSSIVEALEAVERSLKILNLEEKITSIQKEMDSVRIGSPRWFELFREQNSLFDLELKLRKKPVFSVLLSLSCENAACK